MIKYIKNYIKRKIKEFFSCRYWRTCRYYDKDGITCGIYDAQNGYCGVYKNKERSKVNFN